MTADDTFDARFAALAAEAQAEFCEARERVLVLLGEADAVLDELRARGVTVRVQLPLGAGVKLTQLHFLAEFRMHLP